MKHFTYLICTLGLMFITACGGSASKEDDAGLFDGGEVVCTMIGYTAFGMAVNVPAGWDAEQLKQELRIEVTDEKGAVQLQPISGDGPTLTTFSFSGGEVFQMKVTLRSVSTSLANIISPPKGACGGPGPQVSVDFQPPNKIVLTQDP